MMQSRISYFWKDSGASRGYDSGVSLHSHTNQSKETLDFIASMANDYALFRPFFSNRERCARENHGIKIDFAASYWTPPLTPRLAFDLERRQIEDSLDLSALVSITDHDNINAPMLLRTVPSARHIPVSVEWTAPFEETAFHLGVHNLPSATGTEWMARLERYTAEPTDEELGSILAELHELPNVLLIFNHPMWDLYRIGAQKHAHRVDEFMGRFGQYMHALELNGLRGWPENRSVIQLAQRWQTLVISGGDRHGMEPNANVNLTNATSFTEFVHEVRIERRSHVLFMPQYAEPWKHRVLQSTLDAIRDYADFPEGSRRWDERVYHPDANGEIRPLASLWPDGTAPNYIRYAIYAVRLMGHGPLSSGLRMAWNESHELRLALGDREAV